MGLGVGGAVLLLAGTLYFWFLCLAGAGFVSVARGVTLTRRS